MTTQAPTSASALFTAVDYRRSIYSLNDNSPVPDSRIQELLAEAALHVPSAFNSQSARMVLLVRGEHSKFWSMVADVLEGKMKEAEPERWGRMQKRLEGFGKAYGCILFFESEAVVSEFAASSPQYSHLFPGWSDHTSGMHQFVMWAALEAEGFGANLQHYNYEVEVERRARELFSLPSDWSLKAQLVFGGVEEGGWPKEGKEKRPTSEVVRAFGVQA